MMGNMQNQMMDNNMMKNPMMDNMQNPMMDNNMMKNPMMGNMQNQMMGNMQNPMMGDIMKNPMMDNMQNPMMGNMQNQMMDNNMMKNPMMGDIMKNPMMDNMQNQMMGNMMKNPMMGINMMKNMNQFSNHDNEDYKDIITVVFRVPSDYDLNINLITVQCKLEDKASDLIERYRNKIGIFKNHEIFIYNAKQINKNKSLIENGICNYSTIFVINTKAIMGAS